MALASILSPVTAYECDKQEDHKKIETTVNGKIYRLYCNSDMDPKTNLGQAYKSGIPNIEDCLALCAKDPECGHSLYSASRGSCALRPKPSSIKEGALLPLVAKYGAIFSFVYDRDAPTTPQVPVTPDDGKMPGGEDYQIVMPGDGDPPSTPPGNLPSYDCTNNKDHEKIYTVQGKTWELLCNHGNHHLGYRTEPIASLKACMDLCAQDPQCGSAEFHIATNKCELEPDSVATPTAGYHLWVPKKCPNKPRPLAAISNPEQTKDLSCPDNDGKLYEGKDGSWYYIQCCSDSSGAVIRDILKAKSHEECVNQCTAAKDCLSVSFDTTAVAHNCKLYGPGGYSTAHVPGVHHLFATNPPTVQADHFGSRRCASECPEADGQIFAGPSGENFIISCQKRHGTAYLKQVPDRYSSFPACMKACGATPACISVDYEAKSRNCYMSTNSKHPTISAPAFMSAHSAGCSGACAGCHNATSCDDENAKPLKLKNYSCPDDQGRAATVDGVDYQIACQHAISSAYTQVTAPSMEKCVSLCSASSDCEGVNYFPDTKICYHHRGTQADGSAGSISQRGDSDALIKVQSSLAMALASAAGA